MPTNPLWLEHTERAAWDTVKTLRDELEKERKRLERLTRLHPSWPKIVALLDQAKQQFGLTTESYEDVVLDLSRLATESKAECERLKRQFEQQASSSQRITGEDEIKLARAKINLSPSVRWFARLLERRRSLQAKRAPAIDSPGDSKDIRRLLLALELKVEELSQAPRRELLELAVDIGHLALLLARAVRARQRSEA